MSDLILNSLEIQNFRAFDALVIERLGRVNLMVGKNNVGKSSILEAIQLYAYRASAEIVRQVLIARDEIGENYGRMNIEEIEDMGVPVRFLFSGRKMFTTYSGSDKFAIGPVNTGAQLLVEIQWYEEKIDPETKRKVWRPTDNQLSQSDDIGGGLDSYLPGIRVTFAGEVIISIPLLLFFNRARYTAVPSKTAGTVCVSIPANSLDNATLTNLWDNIALKPEEEEVLRSLHIIAPQVERVNFIGQGRGNKRIPVVKVYDTLDPFPLRSLGEGTLRFFGIILALVNAQNGLLLIDEVDSGLHYTVHSDLWRLIFQIAERLNVQVFATTHSLDCILGFQQAIQEVNAGDGMLIRLENRQGHIIPILFDEARLKIATRQEIEVR